MAILSCPVPSTISTLNPNGFQFSIQKYPEIDYFVQAADLPAITLGESVQVSSVHDLKIPGDTMVFSDITVNFLIDADMKNYIAIHDWITGIGFPTGNRAYTDFIKSSKNQNSYTELSKMVSDCTLIVMDANNKPLKRFRFVDAFPTSLSGITFSGTNTDVQYVVGTVTLAYNYYVIE